MYTAQLPGKGTFVIRYPRGRGTNIDWHCPFEEIPVGKGRRLRDGKDIALLSIGPIGKEAEKAIDRAATEKGCSVAHYDMRFLKPVDEELLHEVGKQFSTVITLEDGVVSGGLGSAVLEFMNDHGYQPHVVRMGIPDEFVEHGTVAQLRSLTKMDTEAIYNQIIQLST